jgi:hypothetical protein
VSGHYSEKLDKIKKKARGKRFSLNKSLAPSPYFSSSRYF